MENKVDNQWIWYVPVAVLIVFQLFCRKVLQANEEVPKLARAKNRCQKSGNILKRIEFYNDSFCAMSK